VHECATRVAVEFDSLFDSAGKTDMGRGGVFLHIAAASFMLALFYFILFLKGVSEGLQNKRTDGKTSRSTATAHAVRCFWISSEPSVYRLKTGRKCKWQQELGQVLAQASGLRCPNGSGRY